MKTLHHITLVSVASLLLGGLPAKAILIQSTDPSFGLNSLTIDTSTGLGWLDLTASAGLSYQQVLADTQLGGIFSGFRLATAQEVLTLYNSAGIPGTGDYPASTPAILSLISLVSATSFQDGHPEAFGITATTYQIGSQFATVGAGMDYFLDNGVPEYQVDGALGQPGFGLGETYGTPTVGSWLVADVPETTDASIYILAAAGLICFSFLQRRQILPIQSQEPLPDGSLSSSR